MSKEQHILVLGTADWNQPIATNQHYMTRELAADAGSQITFVESIGLRRPQLHPRDLKRIAGRLTRRPGAHRGTRRPVPPGVDIVSPIVIPIHRPPASGVNRLLLRNLTSAWRAFPGRKVLWTYSPVTYGLEEDADLVVYHCVDLLGKFEGIDESVIDAHERRLSQMAPIAIASSAVVRDHLVGMGFPEVRLWENVADTSTILSELDALLPDHRARGRVVFAGNLTPGKVDFELLGQLADRGLDVCIAGPRAEGGGDVATQLRDLTSRGVEDLGSLGFEALARVLVRCDIGLIPYSINDYTRGVSPLKTFEYAAAGLRVVSTDLPGVTPVPDLVFREGSRAAFVERVVELAASAPSAADLTRLRALSEAHSWSGRGRDARALVAQGA